MTEEILEAELDQYKRPKFKVNIQSLCHYNDSSLCYNRFSYFCLQVALLSGPPGLGKTTLAHIIAKHAGYNVVEMNAR